MSKERLTDSSLIKKEGEKKMGAPRLLQLPSTQKQFSGSPLQLQLNILDASHSTSGAKTCSCKKLSDKKVKAFGLGVAKYG